MIYFIADTHFYHENIIRHCNRPFSSIEEMHENIIRNWNITVSKHDTVFHLGDFSMVRSNQFDFGGVYRLLNGTKYLVRGNHDHKRTERLFTMSFEDVTIRVGKTKLRLRHIYGHDMDYKQTGVFPVFGHYHNTFNPNAEEFGGGACVSVELTGYRPVSAYEILGMKARWDSQHIS